MSWERTLTPDAAAGRRRLTLSGFITALPDLALGLLYIALMTNTLDRGSDVGRGLVRAIPIEFAVIHASGFLALPWVAGWKDRRKVLYPLGLIGLYTLALGIMSAAVGGWWPLAVFWGLMLNRLLAVIVGDIPDDNAFTAWAMTWAGTTTLYVLAVCIGIFGGPDNESRARLMGFLYFTTCGLSELTGWAWVHRWMQNARRRRG